ncbi:cysteine desulfurase [Caldibacillus lycopersici]|uniref:Cysteine desulfurase n=1 Tax=Perspicuibacillus lycopersici TaxID=1325689 RepID=A0AAE3IWK7_9BACI|nr:cysteine desulfurase family protein [Perspicuibacillus lycopersici]MCU9614219.1 cysteine desulfurase [Perspicuibacillus lycopersici]
MIYFDNSATTKPKKEVVDTFTKVATEYYGNPSSIHSIGLQAEKLLMQSRKQIATLLGVKDHEIIFTSGGTEGNNMVLKGVASQFQGRGKHIITSAIEHPSVSNACEQLKRDGFEITYLPVDKNGRIHVEDVKKAIRPDTILVSVMHINNEVGTIQPIEEIGKLLANYPRILFHVDHVQGAGKIPLAFHDIPIDFATLSSHKFHGLKGTGAIYIRDGVKLDPLLAGGNQERNIRSGTENVAGIVAMAKALRISMEKLDEKVANMQKIIAYLRNELALIDDVEIHTPIEYTAPHILNFSVLGYKAEVLVHAIANHEVYVSTTSACSSKRNEPCKTLLAMGVDEEHASSSIRISLSFDNTMQEAKEAVEAIKTSIEKLKLAMRR